MARLGLIEAGGTKFVLGISEGGETIWSSTRIATNTPEETIGAAIDWFAAQGDGYDGFGIASFGPLVLDQASPHFGHIARTPKPYWTGADMIGPFARRFGCPVSIDTDVNAAALAEARWGAGKDVGSLLYLTIGTGIGGGFVSGGHLLGGLSHPEMGHIRVPIHPEDRNFEGCCPFHGRCLEGLASGPAIMKRWGVSLSDLPPGHIGASIIADYLAHACSTFQAILQPARMVIGGGVSATPGLLDAVQQRAAALGGGYFPGDIRQIIVAPTLGARSGLLGALALANRLVRSTSGPAAAAP
jgi:fructokinase